MPSWDIKLFFQRASKHEMTSSSSSSLLLLFNNNKIWRAFIYLLWLYDALMMGPCSVLFREAPIRFGNRRGGKAWLDIVLVGPTRLGPHKKSLFRMIPRARQKYSLICEGQRNIKCQIGKKNSLGQRNMLCIFDHFSLRLLSRARVEPS